MLQSSSSGSFTPRPKPPRSRSNQLANSTSNKQLERAVHDLVGTQAQSFNHVKDAFQYVQQATMMVPETPPYTPELLSSELCQSHEGQAASLRTPQELEELPVQAQRTIQERERVAASIGKTLLDNNTALRSRQNAFLQRIASPEKHKNSPDRKTGDEHQSTLDNLQIPLYGARGEFIESRPPRSPRHSLILQRRHRNTSNGEEAWTDEDEDEFEGYGMATRNDLEKEGILDAKSPSRKRTSAGHSRQISNASTSSYTSDRRYSPKKLSKSASERQLALSLHLQEQHHKLASQNADLEEQLQELEGELQRADVSGKKKLRKLDRELANLRQELQSALERNRELEESLQRDKKSSSGSTTSHSHRTITTWHRTEDRRHAAASPEDALPPDTDSNEGLYSPPLPSINSDFHTFESIPAVAGSPMATMPAAVEPDSSEASIVSQLLKKIAELRETNAAIEQDKEQMDAKLQKASEDFEEMKRKYDFLEDRVIEAEVRTHRVIGWDRRATIGWYSGWDPEEQKTKISPQRRAIGNRAMIERHRRLSSLFGGYPPPPQLYRSTAASAIPTADGSPGKSSLNVSPRSLDPLRDPFTSEDSASPTKKAHIPTAPLDYSNSAAKSEDLEDLIDAMHRQVALDKEQILATQQSLLDQSSLDSVMSGNISCAQLSQIMESTFDATPEGATLLAMTIVAELSKGSEPSPVTHSLLPPGPPDAETYEAMEKALSDVPVEWADDDVSIVQRTLLRDIEAANESPGNRALTRQGPLEWAYEDPEEESSEHDPWKDENGSKDQLGLESREMIEFRQRVDEKSERRRKRIQELAEELLKDERDSEALSAEQTLVALRRVGSDKSISKSQDGADDEDRRSDSSGSGDYEHVTTNRQSGSTGTDYWPISTRARYAPKMVAKRVAVTSQEYVNMCLLWTKFIAVLGVAVAVSVWRGPKEGLGTARLSPRRRTPALPSRVGARRKRIGSMDSLSPGT